MNARSEPTPEWKRYFAEAMGVLRQAYPNQRQSDEEWRSLLRAWSHRLGEFPARVVAEAAWKATEQFPDRMPNLGQFLALVKGYAKSFTREGSPLPKTPRTLLGTEAHVLAASSPFEQLARLWEGEIVHGKVNPNEPPPPEMFARWMKDFWMLMDKNEVGGTKDKFVKGDDGKWQRVREGGQQRERA